MDKKTIIRNFTKCAWVYDKYADIQESAAKTLIDGINEKKVNRILEIGCGTGNYTRLLRAKFKKAKIKAIDISARMVEVAKEKLNNKQIEFIVEDAETMPPEEKADLITSNACFQWFNNLEKALERYCESLNKNGIISFSIFGPDTFRELNIALNCVLKDTAVTANGFLAKEEINFMMKKFFKDVTVGEIEYEQTSLCLKDLLKKIKYTGAQSNSFSGKKHFSLGTFKKIEDAYLSKFKKIKATYQILFFSGKKI